MTIPASNLLRTVAVTTVTVFDEAGDVDAPSIRANIEFLVSAGIKLVVPCGGTGEFSSLSPAEWRVVVEAVCGSGRSIDVVPAIGGPLPVAIEMARFAASHGATGVMVMPIRHPFATAAGAGAYLDAVLDTGIGVIAYMKDDPLTEEVVARVAGHPGFLGIKYARQETHRLRQALAAVDRPVAWSCGLAETRAPEYFLAGAVGFTSGLANFAPGVSLELHAALCAGDWAGIQRCLNSLATFEALRGQDGGRLNVSAVKRAMDLVGLRGGLVRRPLDEIEAGSAELAAITEPLRRWADRPSLPASAS